MPLTVKSEPVEPTPQDSAPSSNPSPASFWRCLRERWKVVADYVPRPIKIVIATVVGVSLIIIGIILCPLPGPGVAIIVAGIAVLASEYIWARQLLKRIHHWWQWAKTEYLLPCWHRCRAWFRKGR